MKSIVAVTAGQLPRSGLVQRHADKLRAPKATISFIGWLAGAVIGMSLFQYHDFRLAAAARDVNAHIALLVALGYQIQPRLADL